MTTDDILSRYAEALYATVEDGKLHGQAIALALRLAVQDAYAAGGALADDLAAIVASQAAAVGHVSNVTDQRVVESAINQIGRLTEWLAEEEPALCADNNLDTAAAILQAIRRREHDLVIAYHDLHGAIGDADDLRQQLVKLDADNARLISSVMAGDKMQETLRQAIADRDAEIDRLTRQNVIATDTFNSLAERTNGAAAVGHVSNVPEPPVEWWHDLDHETNDYRISLDAGRRKFREVPKPQRLLLAQTFARCIGGGALPKQSEFDTHKPDWMPGGGGLVTTFGCNWSELLNLTPAEVAP